MIAFLELVLRSSVPLVLASLAGLFSERSGLVQIGLESFLLISAFFGAAVAASTGSLAFGMGAAILSGIVMGLVFGGLTIRLKSDQIVAGMALNLLALGVTPFFTKLWFGSASDTPNLPTELRLGNGFLLAVFLLAILVHLFFRYTRDGITISFAGENPKALEVEGVSVSGVRWKAMVLCGAFAGLAGASLSLFLASYFTRGISAGRGYMALACLILGRWRPIPTLFACLLFGLADGLQVRLQGLEIGAWEIPTPLIQMIPYLTTIAVLVVGYGNARAPKALGK